MGYLRTRNLGRTLNAWISCSWNIANQSATPDYLYLTQSIRSIELCGSQMIRQIDCIWTPSRLPLLGFGPHRWRKNEANLKEVEWRFCVWILKEVRSLHSVSVASLLFICPAAFRVSVFFLSWPLSRNSAHPLVSSFGWSLSFQGLLFLDPCCLLCRSLNVHGGFRWAFSFLKKMKSQHLTLSCYGTSSDLSIL